MADSLSRGDSSVGDPTEEGPSVSARLYRGGVESVTARRERHDETPKRTEAVIATASTRAFSGSDGSRSRSPIETLTATKRRVVERRRDVRRARGARGT